MPNVQEGGDPPPAAADATSASIASQQQGQEIEVEVVGAATGSASSRNKFPRLKGTKNGATIYPFLTDKNYKDLTLVRQLMIHRPYIAGHGAKGVKWAALTKDLKKEKDPKDNLIFSDDLHADTVKSRFDKLMDWVKMLNGKIPFLSGCDDEEPPGELQQALEYIYEEYESHKSKAKDKREKEAGRKQNNLAGAAALRAAALGGFVPKAPEGTDKELFLLQNMTSTGTTGMENSSNVNSNDGSVNEPKRKKLRFTEPDLCILVGQDRQEYWCYSMVMASHSSLIDTKLATLMEKRESLEIEFPHVDVDVWKTMMAFSQPKDAPDMTFDHVRMIARACDKYKFVGLSQYCDKVLSKHIDNIKHQPTHAELIDALLLANDANLENSKERAVATLGEKLRSAGDFVDPVFTVDQIEKLVPVLEQDNVRDDLGLGKWTREAISCPLFPELLIEHWARKRAEKDRDALQAVIDAVDSIEVQGLESAGLAPPLRILTKRATFFADDGEELKVAQDDGGEWVIFVRGRRLYESCRGAGSPFPPTHGWIECGGFGVRPAPTTIKLMSSPQERLGRRGAV